MGEKKRGNRFFQAMEKYLKNPGICKQCKKPIIKEGKRPCEMRALTFCSCSCAAIYNGENRTITKKAKLCKCGKQIDRTDSKCTECKEKLNNKSIKNHTNITKNEIFGKRANYQSARSAIRKHAEKIFELNGKEKVCVVCGYDKHINISHKKAVSDFDGNTTLGEINSIENLVALCPTHHWEFDHGLIVL